MIIQCLFDFKGDYGVMQRADGEEGSLFFFTFPYRPDVTKRIEANTTELESVEVGGDNLKVPRPESLSVRGLRVLLVDDTHTVLKFTRKFLSKDDHIVTCLENGKECLDLLRSNKDEAAEFDLIISDLQMPVMDGYTWVEQFRAFEQQFLTHRLNCGKRLTIIGMSANEGCHEEALAAGFDAYLVKPFSYKDIKYLIDTLFQHPCGNATPNLGEQALIKEASRRWTGMYCILYYYVYCMHCTLHTLYTILIV